mgnify:CR=1 FL=1
MAKKRKSNQVEVQDVKEAYGLFMDSKRSKAFIEQYEKEFNFLLDVSTTTTNGGGGGGGQNNQQTLMEGSESSMEI